VSFYRLKAEILGDLESAGLLQRFDMSESRAAIHVKDPNQLVIFGADYLELVALKPSADMDSLRAAVECIWQRLEPATVNRVRIWLRFITPTNTDYDGARASIGDSINPWPTGVRNVDFAVIGDLADDDLDATLHYEYGIVEQQEAAMRLASGQPGLEENRAVAPSLIPAELLPQVAIYHSQDWRLASSGIKSQAECFELLLRTHKRGEQIDMALCEHLLGGSA
jgi:hypothetical protein